MVLKRALYWLMALERTRRWFTFHPFTFLTLSFSFLFPFYVLGFLDLYLLFIISLLYSPLS